MAAEPGKMAVRRATNKPRVRFTPRKPQRAHRRGADPAAWRHPGLEDDHSAGAGRTRAAHHEGYEWLYVLAGRVRPVLADHDITLGPGSVAELDT
jgi:hypothetical protein